MIKHVPGPFPTRSRAVIHEGRVHAVSFVTDKKPDMYLQTKSALAHIDATLRDAGTDKSHFRVWHFSASSDVRCSSLSGVKRTSPIKTVMPASDPTETWANSTSAGLSSNRHCCPSGQAAMARPPRPAFSPRRRLQASP